MSFTAREIRLAKGDIYENMLPIHVENGVFEPHHDFHIRGWEEDRIFLTSVEPIRDVVDSQGRPCSVNELVCDWDDFAKFRMIKRLNP
jgi:hypothetical protein